MIRMTEGLKMEDNLYEVRKFVLSGLIKEGYKYIARDKDGEFYAYSNKPVKLEKSWLYINHSNTNYLKNISLVSFILADIKWEDEKPFEIPYTDWKEVPINTPGIKKDKDIL